MKRAQWAVLVVSVAGGGVCAARNKDADPWLYLSVVAHGFAAGVASVYLERARKP